MDGDEDTDRYVDDTVAIDSDTSEWDHGTAAGHPLAERGTDTHGASDGSGGTYGRSIVRKIETLVGIVAREHSRCGARSDGCNVLNLADPLRIRNAVHKVTKRNFIAFKEARMRGVANGSLDYLYVGRDSMTAVSRFRELVTDGTYKTNVPDAHGGRFAVTMNQVRGNVTALPDRRRGRGSAAGPQSVTAETVTVTAGAGADQPEVEAVRRSVDAKYRAVLTRALAAELKASTAKGLVAGLRTEMKIPISPATTVDPLLVVGTDENGLNVRMSVAINNSYARHHRPGYRGYVDSLRYDRTSDNAYEMRFDVLVNRFRWTGDLEVTAPGGRTDRWRSVEFSAKDLRFHVTVVMYIPDARQPQACQRIHTVVQTKDVRYELPPGSAAPEMAVSGDSQARFLERALEDQVTDSLTRDLCRGQVDDRTTHQIKPDGPLTFQAV